MLMPIFLLIFSVRYVFANTSLKKEPIRGVNLGGWLLLEPYITPSIFEEFRTNDDNDDGIPVDEYHFCKQLGSTKAAEKLIQHWSTFYTEEDFIDIASHGFNLVRIPIGYWAFAKLPNDPYVSGYQEEYLDKAIQWASNNNLKVWIDLHGAAGSQNGFDNSGLRDTINFLEDTNLAVTMNALNYLMTKYSKNKYSDVVKGIELLNEPLGPAIDMNVLKTKFVLPSYNYMRRILGKEQTVVLHDSFQSYNYWDDFFTNAQTFQNVILDHHHYQVFSPGELNRTQQEKLNAICGWGQASLTEACPSVVGEFSAALTDCTKWLNGVGRGARYDKTFLQDAQDAQYFGKCTHINDINMWTESMVKDTRIYIEAQLDAFETNMGWIFWCYKTESSIEWDARRLIKYGLFPQPLESRLFSPKCLF